MKKKRAFLEVLLSQKKNAVRLVAVLFICVVLLSLVPDSVSVLDASGGDTYRTGAQTEALLAALDEDVTLYYTVDGGMKNVDERFLAFLRSYARADNRISVKVVDSTDRTFLSEHGLLSLESGSVLVESAKRFRVVNHSTLTFLYNSYIGLQLTTAEYYAAISALVQGSESNSELYEVGALLYQYADYTETYFRGEECIGSALLFVTAPKVPVMYIISDAEASLPDSGLQTELYDSLYDLRVHSLSDGDVPQDCDVLLLHAPQKDLTAEEAERLRSYLQSGGKLFLTTLCGISYPMLETVLADYGLSFYEKGNMVCEEKKSYLYTDENSKQYPYYFEAHIAPMEATAGLTDGFLTLYAHAIKISETAEVQVTPWLYTSESGYLVHKTDNAEGTEGSFSESGTYVFGAVAQKGESTVAWLGAGYALTDAVNTAAEGGNYSYVGALLDWMSHSSYTPLSIEGKRMADTMLYPTLTDAIIWGVLLAVLAPLAVLLIGFSVRANRKRK